MDRSFDCRQRSKWSEPPFLTSKFLLSESVVNVIIRKLFIRHSLFPPHAQPSLLPVKEAVSVLSLPKASQPSKTLINEVRVHQPRQLAAYAWILTSRDIMTSGDMTALMLQMMKQIHE